MTTELAIASATTIALPAIAPLCAHTGKPVQIGDYVCVSYPGQPAECWTVTTPEKWAESYRQQKKQDANRLQYHLPLQRVVAV